MTRTSLPGADPDAGSWLVTLVLLVAGAAALRLVWTVDSAARRARVFWLGIGLAALALAVNKQVDAQVYLVEGSAASVLDLSVGWVRDLPIGVAVLGLIVGAAVSALTLIWATSGMSRFRLAVAGLVVLVLVALLRTAEIVRLGPVSLRLDHDAALPFELAGAAVLLLAAGRERWIHRPSRRHDPTRAAAP